MRITLPAVAMIVTVTSAVVDSHSYSPAAHVRALGIGAFHKARSQTMLSGRRMEAIDDNEWSKVVGAIVPMMCGLMEMDEFQEGFYEGLAESEVEGISITCPVFGCDDPSAEVPNLVMYCSMDGVVCEEYKESNEEVCITGTDVQMSMGLNYIGDSRLTSTQCSTYTSPDYMADMGRGCWDIAVTLKMGDMMDDITSGEYDPETLTKEEATTAALEYFEIIECSGEFEDGTTCECGLCNEGKGYHLTCTNQLASQECTNFDISAADVDVDAITNGDGLAVSIMRLLPTSGGDIVKPGALGEGHVELDDHGRDGGTFTRTKTGTSHAASRTEAVAAGFILVMASFLVLVLESVRIRKQTNSL